MLPHLIGRRGAGAYVPIVSGGGTGTGVTDGGFVEPPIVTTTASGNTTIKGKVKAGSFGKFVVPLANIAAGRQYTFRYTPQFSQLAQQGKLAMVGIGMKTNNDFHLLGLRGDGSTGLHSYEVYGTPPNGWNAQTGHSVIDGGAAVSGTQAGPNYIRLIVSADGTTVTLKSGTDGASWNTERSNVAISPFSNVSGVTTFGMALWFNNADAGPFSIVVDQFADAAAPSGTLNPLDKDSTLALSNGNLTGTATGPLIQWRSVRSETSHSSGKWYYEWVPNVFAGSFIGAGFANSLAAVGNYFGLDGNGIEVATDGKIYKDGAAGVAALGTLTSGDVIGIAIDISANKFWCRRGTGIWNGSGTDNPATGSGGLALGTGMTAAIFAGISVQSSGDQGSVNFGATSFVNGPPSGFTAWG